MSSQNLLVNPVIDNVALGPESSPLRAFSVSSFNDTSSQRGQQQVATTNLAELLEIRSDVFDGRRRAETTYEHLLRLRNQLHTVVTMSHNRVK